jgi:catechol 2,3-dioxygenase-like lactoylglutathione lyase family enzyme
VSHLATSHTAHFITMPLSRALASVVALDHLVLTVRSIPATIAWYERLGMRHEPFRTPGGVRHALRYGLSKINLHEAGKEFSPRATTPLPGTADLCFLVDENVGEVKERLEQAGIEILEGGEIVPRVGARGNLLSVYVRDPDGNLIE